MYTSDNNHRSSLKMDIASVSPSPSEHQQYALKWNDFQSSILSSFRHLRDEEDFVDVTLACDQRSFTAHKVRGLHSHGFWDCVKVRISICRLFLALVVLIFENC